MIGGHFLKGWSRTQNHVTLSSAEAELIALVKCSAELMGMRSAMRDWGVESSGVVYADSSAALAIANRKGAGKLRHINISSLWIQEKQDLHQLEMRKVLGTENPADLMTKYLTRAVMDTHLEYLSQRRESGRARSGLNIQGKSAPGNADSSTATGDRVNICLEDDWMKPASSHQIWPTLWMGETHFEATDGSWKSVRHTAKRRALMTPKRVAGLKLPSGVEWTGKRRTVIHPIGCTDPGSRSDQAAPELNTRNKSEDQPTTFKDEGQGHKRRTQQRCESTLSP